MEKIALNLLKMNLYNKTNAETIKVSISKSGSKTYPAFYGRQNQCFYLFGKNYSQSNPVERILSLNSLIEQNKMICI